MIKTRGYRGTGPEVVLVGFEEVCPLGYAEDKYQWMKNGALNAVDLSLKMGILEFRKTPDGKTALYEVKAIPEDMAALPPALTAEAVRLIDESPAGLSEFSERWMPYLKENTGLRRLTIENCGFDPNNFQTLQIKRTRHESLTAEQLQLLQSLHLQLEEVESRGDNFAATVVSVEDIPFPFPLDIGGALPTGWRMDNLGLPPKEVRKMNVAILLVFETAYRTLLHSTLHPAQTRLDELFKPQEISLHTPTGMGPMMEIENIGLTTFHKESAKPKQLSHSLANTVLGYLAPTLNIKGKISAHVGACESVMGGIGDAFRDLKSGQFKAALVVGYDWSMTAVSYNGFVANGAFITNEQIVKTAKKLYDEGIITDATLHAEVNRRVAREAELADQINKVDRRMKNQEISREQARSEKAVLQKEKLQVYQRLPKKLYEMASMPFHKYRSGFVMSIGSGGGFFTTLENAVQHGLPIRAIVAGAGEKVPDGAGDGYGSIAVLGDGVGDAFEKSFLEARRNYQMIDTKGQAREVTIEDVGAWWAHGTSTPTNGYGERREMHRILAKYGRKPEHPLLLTGDKEIGHRIGGNFPTGAAYILNDETLYPYKNYNLADDAVEKEFPLSRVVGKAGEGQGKPVPFKGEFIAINGAGFGKINSNIMLKKFRVEDLDLSEEQKQTYRQQCAERLEAQRKLKERIRRSEVPIVLDTADTAKSRGEVSNMSKLIGKKEAT